MSEFSAFPLAVKNTLTEFRIEPRLFVDGKLAVPSHLNHRLHCQTVGKTMENLEIDWDGFARPETIHLWARKDCAPTANKQMVSISHSLNDAFFAGKTSFFDRTTTLVSFCCLFAQNRSIENMRDNGLANLTRDIQ